jgi:hypothetical protein
VHTPVLFETNNEPNRRTVPEIMREFGTKCWPERKWFFRFGTSAQTEVAPARPSHGRFMYDTQKARSDSASSCQRGASPTWWAKDGPTRALENFVDVQSSSLLVDGLFWSLRREPETRHLLGRSVLTRTLALWWTPRRKTLTQ